MLKIGGFLVEFNIAISKRFAAIRKWRPLILFVKIPHPADSFISKNEGMAKLIHMSNPASASSVIVRDGHIIASDLDANIRLQIMRDYQRASANGGGN